MEELEIQEKPALKVFKNITVIQEPGMVILEVRWDHLPKQGGGNVLSSHVIIEKMGFFQIRKKIFGKYLVYIFLCKISFKYRIARHFLYSYNSIDTNNKLRLSI